MKLQRSTLATPSTRTASSVTDHVSSAVTCASVPVSNLNARGWPGFFSFPKNAKPSQERPGLGWDRTATDLAALRLPTQAADAHIPAHARAAALESKNVTRSRSGQHRLLPSQRHACPDITNPRLALEALRLGRQQPRCIERPKSLQTAKYYPLHDRERSNFCCIHRRGRNHASKASGCWVDVTCTG